MGGRDVADPARVLFVESYPQGLYGQQHTLLALLDACDRARVTPVVAAPFDGPALEPVRARGVDVELLPYPSLLMPYGGAIYGYGGVRKLRLGVQVAGYLRALRRRLGALGVAGVYCNDMRGILTVGAAARSRGLPVMTWDKLDRPHGWMDRLQLPIVTRNLCISEAVKAKYPPGQVRRYADRLATVPNGIDVAAFDRGRPIREALGLDEDAFVVGIAGRISERKGHDRLLAVVPALVDALADALPGGARVVVAGAAVSDEERAYEAALPNRGHPAVTFLGQRDDIADVMHSLDVLVVPSRHEGMGRVVAEAMACRLPVVGARAGGIPEIVADGETGILVDGDDGAALLAALVRLGRAPGLRRRMGEAGRARVERHFNGPVQIAKVLEEVYGMVGV